MDAHAHYRRAVELADEADLYLKAGDKPFTEQADRDRCLRRAEVLATMAAARFKGALVAYMGADIDAAAQLVEDAKTGPADPAVTPLDIPPRLDARRRRPGPA